MTGLILPVIYRSADYAPDTLRRAVHTGALQMIRRGAYVQRPSTAGPDQLQEQVLARCSAVAQSLTGHFAFSHQTAAFLHQVPVTVTAAYVHILQTVKPAGDSADDLIRHVTRELPAEDLTTIAGLPVTTLHRTLLDCARTIHPREGLAVADAILRRLAGVSRFNYTETAGDQRALRELSLHRINELGPVPGVVRARAVVAHADGRAESPGESRLRWLVLTGGFIAPTLQPRISTSSGIFYPDLGWETSEEGEQACRWVVIEYDGVAKYRSTEDLFREKQREDALREAGCAVIRVTSDHLARPTRLLQSLSRHIAIAPATGSARRGLRPPAPRRPM